MLITLLSNYKNYRLFTTTLTENKKHHSTYRAFKLSVTQQ